MSTADTLGGPGVTPLLGAVRPGTMLVGGEWRPAGGAGVVEVVDPGTGRPIGTVADATPTDAVDAVTAAERALPSWAATPPRQRAEVLSRARDLVLAEEDALAELMVLENGKTLADARAEVRYAAEFFRWYAEEAVRLPGTLQVAPDGAHRILTFHQPIGVCLLITPWNFPAAMVTRKVGPALAAGCTVVLKPAVETPMTALALATILERAGLPAGVLNVLPTQRPAEFTTAVLADQRVRKLSFTGSTAVGRILLAQAADSVLHCSMELGGNAPFLVLDDADLDEALAGAQVAKLRNGGQACTAANRFLVHVSRIEEFSRRLTEVMGGLRVGHGLSADTQVGPVISDRARATLADRVDAAVRSGATVRTGGRPLDTPGYFYQPTVLTGLAPDAPILGVELFGPVAPVVGFETDEEAIALANNTELGLVSFVYTSDLRRGLRFAEALEAGMVAVNRGMLSEPAAPFGGVKHSGLGREGAREGLLEFTECKYVSTVW